MRVEIKASLEDYIRFGDETTQELLTGNGSLIQAVKACYAFFPETLWTDVSDTRPVPMIVAINTFMLYVSSIRIAITGHAAAIFPNLKAALESACYAFLMIDDQKLEEIWTNRHDDKQSLALCRKRFTPAVGLTAEKLNKIEAKSGDFITDAYNAAIDYGGHPNPRSIYTYVTLDQKRDDNLVGVGLGGLYDSSALEVSRSLLACLDFGLAIAIVLARCLASPPPATQAKLAELNNIRERLAAELNI